MVHSSVEDSFTAGAGQETLTDLDAAHGVPQRIMRCSPGEGRKMAMNFKTLMLGAVFIPICAGASISIAGDEGVRELGKHAVAYEGSEIEVAVNFFQAEGDIGERWLIIVAYLAGVQGGDVSRVSRSEVSVRSPEGQRLELMTQAEYREVYGKIRTRVQRALSTAGTFRTVGGSHRPCGRWFLEEPGKGFGRDEMQIGRNEECTGPMVFTVPGGVQPGRWRLVIELEESLVDLPFELEGP